MRAYPHSGREILWGLAPTQRLSSAFLRSPTANCAFGYKRKQQADMLKC